jgi:porin
MSVVKSSLWSTTFILAAFYTTALFADNSKTDKDQEDSPYKLGMLYTGEEWYNARGGLRAGNSYMNNIDLRLSTDLDKAYGWKGGKFIAEGWYENAPSTGVQYVGSLDQPSPIDAAWTTDIWRLYQLFYDQKIGKADILLGLLDLETEFSRTKPMYFFLTKNLTWNTALDQSGTMPENGAVGPGNYPYTPLTARFKYEFTPEVTFKLAIADGVSDNPNNQAMNGFYFSTDYGAMGISELDYHPDKFTKIMAGGWYLTSKLPRNLTYNEQDYIWGQGGFYVGAASRIYEQTEEKGLDAFVTFGYSTPDSTNVTESLNGGLLYTGLLDIRPKDRIGVAFNINLPPGSYKQARILSGADSVDNYETTFEVVYYARITDWLTVQPDFQYTINPNYDPTLQNSALFGIHFELSNNFNI